MGDSVGVNTVPPPLSFILCGAAGNCLGGGMGSPPSSKPCVGDLRYGMCGETFDQYVLPMDGKTHLGAPAPPRMGRQAAGTTGMTPSQP